MYRSMLRGISGCPCCVGLQACKCNSLQSLFPRVAAEWDYERDKGTPADVAAYFQKTVCWHNSHRGHFKARIAHRTYRWTPGQHTGQVRQVQPASPCDVSPMRPAYETALVPYSSYISSCVQTCLASLLWNRPGVQGNLPCNAYLTYTSLNLSS